MREFVLHHPVRLQGTRGTGTTSRGARQHPRTGRALSIRPRGDGRDRRGPCCPHPHPPHAGYRCRWLPTAPQSRTLLGAQPGMWDPPPPVVRTRGGAHGTAPVSWGGAARPGGCSTSAHGSSTSPTPLTLGTNPHNCHQRWAQPPGTLLLVPCPHPRAGGPTCRAHLDPGWGSREPPFAAPKADTQPRAAPGTPSPILGREQGAGEGLRRGERGRLKPSTESTRKRAC